MHNFKVGSQYLLIVRPHYDCPPNVTGDSKVPPNRDPKKNLGPIQGMDTILYMHVPPIIEIIEKAKIFWGNLMLGNLQGNLKGKLQGVFRENLCLGDLNGGGDSNPVGPQIACLSVPYIFIICFPL